MKVKELIEKLQKIDGNTEVIFADFEKVKKVVCIKDTNTGKNKVVITDR